MRVRGALPEVSPLGSFWFAGVNRHVRLLVHRSILLGARAEFLCSGDLSPSPTSLTTLTLGPGFSTSGTDPGPVSQAPGLVHFRADS